jgi:hypothetical protein
VCGLAQRQQAKRQYYQVLTGLSRRVSMTSLTVCKHQQLEPQALKNNTENEFTTWSYKWDDRRNLSTIMHRSFRLKVHELEKKRCDLTSEIFKRLRKHMLSFFSGEKRSKTHNLKEKILLPKISRFWRSKYVSLWEKQFKNPIFKLH